MRSKNFLKILLLVGIISGIMILFGEAKVKAYDIDINDTYYIYRDVMQGTPTANSLDNIPNTITLDMKETNPEDIINIIYDKVETELKAQEITLKEMDDNRAEYSLSINLFSDSYWQVAKLKEPIDKIGVYISKNNNYTPDRIVEKTITINWTNKSTYNETDKKYVENQLSKLPQFTSAYSTDADGLPTQYYMTEQEHEFGTEYLNILSTFKKITGLNFVYSIGSGGGPGDPFDLGYEFMVGVYKDGICYKTITVLPLPPTKITVPNNIEDTNEAYMNYALPIIQEYIDGYYDDWYHGKVSLEKINDYSYKVLSDGEKNCGEIIIKKENGVPVGNNIYVNNLLSNEKITVTQKNNATLENEVKDKGFTKLLGSYEITLTGADKLNIPIDITFNVGTNYNGKMACVLHKKKDGTNEKFEERVVDGKVTITVDELSPFVVAVKEKDDYLLGDVDGSGEVNAQDAVMILKYVAHNIELNDKQLLAANTTKDEAGTVDARDAVQILKLVAHNITEF